jgi:hypothetical protein
MGKSFSGSTVHEKNISMLTPEQQTLLKSITSGLGPQYQEMFSQFLTPKTQEESFAEFEKMYGEPAKQAFSQYITPAITQQYGDVNAASSSALNQALAKSASDLSTSIGSQYGQYQQNENQQMLSALGILGPQLFQQSFSPLINKKEGWGGGAMQMTGDLMKALAMFAASSISVKDNIIPYNEGLDLIEKLEVKHYDYKPETGLPLDRVGLIAETLPKELTMSINDILHVDVYGLVSVLINAVKELSEKVKILEAK